MIPHTHTQRKRAVVTQPHSLLPHKHTHNYELMRPERKNEGHVRLEMKHKSSTICLFVQTRATHTQIERNDT